MRVMVVGAGVAGCAAAQRLHERGHHVIVAEANSSIGGRAHTLTEDGVSFEAGGDTVLSVYTDTRTLIAQLGLKDALVMLRTKAGVHDGRQLRLFSASSPLSYARSSILSGRDRIKVGTGYLRAIVTPSVPLFDDLEPARLGNDQSMAAWATRHLGGTVLSYIIRPSIESRWYFSCDELPAAIAVRLIRRTPGIRMFCFAGGMSRFLRELLLGVQYHTDAQVSHVEMVRGGARVYVNGGTVECDAVVVATDAVAAARLLPRSVKEREVLARCAYSRSVRVLVGYGQDPWSTFRADSIVPVVDDACPIASVSLASRKSTGLIPAGRQVVAVHLTGPASRRMTDREAIRTACAAIEHYLPPAEQRPSFIRLVRWERALPIPQLKRLRELQTARDGMPKGIALAGDYFALPTIESAVRSGQRAADRLRV